MLRPGSAMTSHVASPAWLTSARVAGDQAVQLSGEGRAVGAEVEVQAVLAGPGTVEPPDFEHHARNRFGQVDSGVVAEDLSPAERCLPEPERPGQDRWPRATGR